MQFVNDLVWKAPALWAGLNFPEKIVAAMNLAWAGFWLFIIVGAEASGANGWGIILGGIAWFWGQAALAIIGLTVVALFGGKSRN